MAVEKIILLTGTVEAPILAQILQRYNEALDIVPAHCAEELNDLCAAPFNGARLLSFCSPVIVPAAILSRLGTPAYNFHPGPPERPGRYPAVFAIYENATQFGVTVHEMIPAVDAGPIVTANWFNIPTGCDVVDLEKLTLESLLSAFQRLAPYMATVSRPLPRLLTRWSGRKTSKADCLALRKITNQMDPDEIARRRRACGDLIVED